MKKATERNLLGPSSKGMECISVGESETATSANRLEALRDELITKARQGEISPQQAEAEAAGLPPLAFEPPPFPKTARLTPAEAERDLWRQLSEGRLSAEAFDRGDILVEIPTRAWEHLKRFEDNSPQQISKYHALNNDPAFSEVRFKRDDLLALVQSDSELKAELFGEVKINFASETVPLKIYYFQGEMRSGFAAEAITMTIRKVTASSPRSASERSQIKATAGRPA
jgi:hypothetical protein